MVHIPVPQQRPLAPRQHVRREQKQLHYRRDPRDDAHVETVLLAQAQPEAAHRKRDDVAEQEGDDDGRRQLEPDPARPVLVVERGPQENDLAQGVADGARHPPAKDREEVLELGRKWATEPVEGVVDGRPVLASRSNRQEDEVAKTLLMKVVILL